MLVAHSPSSPRSRRSARSRHDPERRRLVRGCREGAWSPPNWIFGPVWTVLYTADGRRGLAGVAAPRTRCDGAAPVHALRHPAGAERALDAGVLRPLPRARPAALWIALGSSSRWMCWCSPPWCRSGGSRRPPRGCSCRTGRGCCSRRPSTPPSRCSELGVALRARRGNRSPISATSSGVGVQATDAAAFCRSCSGRVAPAITLDSAGCASSQPNVAASIVMPRVGATSARSASIASQGAFSTMCGACRMMRLSAGHSLRGELAGEQAVREREVRQEAEAGVARPPAAHRAPRPREIRLYSFWADTKRPPPAVRGLASICSAREVGMAVGADLALASRARRAPRWCRRSGSAVGHVQLVEVDAVGLQPAQRSLDRGSDVLGASRVRHAGQRCQVVAGVAELASRCTTRRGDP